MRTSTPLTRLSVLLVAALTCLSWIGEAAAEEKSIFSPIIHVDKEKGYIVVSSDSGIIGVEVSEAAKPHLDKLPISGMIDIVVELRPGNAPLLKSWKVAGGESACKHFDGTTCK
ncbi:MAG: hypothetical protein HY581_11195 [Nitrospirae bacterium]|nr:hypothetical protein [Nitrospirota bacterium]